MFRLEESRNGWKVCRKYKYEGKDKTVKNKLIHRILAHFAYTKYDDHFIRDFGRRAYIVSIPAVNTTGGDKGS